jgi:hypothetical protein
VAHHGAHHTRTFTVTVPLPAWTLQGARRRLRRAEERAAYHWAFVSYALLTLATAGYVIAQLVTV